MRVRRIMLNHLAGTSLMLTVALAIVWASQCLPRAYRIRFDWTPIDFHDTVIQLGCNSNMLMLVDYRRDAHPVSRSQADAILASQPNPIIHDTWIRLKWSDEPFFGYSSDGQITISGTARVYLIPFGLLLLLFAILPAWRWLPTAVRRTRRRFVVPPGHCLKCGYDLRASPDFCPECGTPCKPDPVPA